MLIDSTASTWNLSPELVAEELSARRADPPKAAILVDLYGQVADHHAIGPLLAEHGVLHLADAAESLGATYDGRPAASYGASAALSFNGNKIITTTGGGMLVTDDAAVADRVRHLATQAREPVPHYEHVEVGLQLPALQPAGRLRAGPARRPRPAGGAPASDLRSLRRRRSAHLPGVAFMPEAPTGRANRWLTCLTIDASVAGYTPAEVREHLESLDIEARPTWKPMHLQPVFQRLPGPARRHVGSAVRARACACRAAARLTARRPGSRVIDGRSCDRRRRPGRRGMKVVVTGGAGFIGANLCRRLLADAGVDEVVALDDLSTGFAANLDGRRRRARRGRPGRP